MIEILKPFGVGQYHSSIGLAALALLLTALLLAFALPDLNLAALDLPTLDLAAFFFARAMTLPPLSIAMSESPFDLGSHQANRNQPATPRRPGGRWTNTTFAGYSCEFGLQAPGPTGRPHRVTKGDNVMRRNLCRGRAGRRSAGGAAAGARAQRASADRAGQTGQESKSQKTADRRSARRAQARQKICGAEWRAAKKAGKIEKGLTWPKYWSACNKRLARGRQIAFAWRARAAVLGARSRARSMHAAQRQRRPKSLRASARQ